MPISYKVVDLFLWQEEIQIQHPSIPRNFPSFCGQATAVGLDLNRRPLRSTAPGWRSSATSVASPERLIAVGNFGSRNQG